MVATNYNASIERVLAHEGGYTNHPSDPGGPTNWGITIHDARRYWKRTATAADVKAMPLSVAREIYRSKYWDAQRCDELPGGVDYIMFDYGVNSGIGRSGKVLRRVLGLRADTSVVTDQVLAEAALRKPADLVTALCSERIRFLQSLRTWPVFGKGWGRRVAESRRDALEMVSAKTPATVPVVKPDKAAGKGTVPVPALARPSNAASSGAVVSAAAGAATAASGGSADYTTYVVIAALVAVAVLFGFVAWRYRRQANEPMPNTPVVPVETQK